MAWLATLILEFQVPSMTNERAISIDGCLTDPARVGSHHQAVPFPGGHYYTVTIRSPSAVRRFLKPLKPYLDRVSSLADLSTNPGGKTYTQLPDTAAEAILHAFHDEFGPFDGAAGECLYVLNSVTGLFVGEDLLEWSGECSPFVSNF